MVGGETYNELMCIRWNGSQTSSSSSWRSDMMSNSKQKNSRHVLRIHPTLPPPEEEEENRKKNVTKTVSPWLKLLLSRVWPLAWLKWCTYCRCLRKHLKCHLLQSNRHGFRNRLKCHLLKSIILSLSLFSVNDIEPVPTLISYFELLLSLTLRTTHPPSPPLVFTFLPSYWEISEDTYFLVKSRYLSIQCPWVLNLSFTHMSKFLSSPWVRETCDTRVAEIVTRELQKVKPGKWGYVQSRELWSPKEETHVRPGHYWLLKFGKVVGNMSCVEKEFILVPVGARSTRGGVSTTVTTTSWLTCGFIEWMRMPQVWPLRNGTRHRILILPWLRWQWSSTLQRCTPQTWYRYNSRWRHVKGVLRTEWPSTRFTVWVPGGMYSPWIMWVNMS